MQKTGMQNWLKLRFELIKGDPVQTLGLALLFLFPVFAVSVRHWSSALFLLLVILAIFSFKANRARVLLSAVERTLLALLGLFFLAYVISSLVNGWNEGATRLLEREIRFLLFIPLYFLIKRLPSPIVALGSGAALALLIMAVLAPIQAFLLGYGRDIGTYGPLFTGPICVLLLILALGWLHSAVDDRYREKLATFLFLLTFLIAALTSRSALLGLGVVFALYYTVVLRARRQFFVAAFLFSGLIVIHELLSNPVIPQFSQGIVEAYNYFFRGAEFVASEPSSIGIRLEMWRSLIYFVEDYPFWGVGGYNYSQVLAGYAQQGLVAQTIVENSHPHNLFGQILVAKGLVGLLIFTAFYCLSFVHLLGGPDPTSRRQSKLFGIIFLATLLVLNLTESAPVLKGNYIAFWLVAYGVLMAWASKKRAD